MSPSPTTSTGSLPRQRPRPARPLRFAAAQVLKGPRHRDLVAAAELEHETPTDWTGRCDARRCTGACVVWRVKAARQAQQNRSAS